jgi:hypothetical protein
MVALAARFGIEADFTPLVGSGIFSVNAPPLEQAILGAGARLVL